MSNKKTPLTVEQHIKFGRMLKQIANMLLEIDRPLGQAVRKTSRQTRKMDRAMDAIQALRTAMDILMFDTLEGEPGVAGDVYFGALLENESDG